MSNVFRMPMIFDPQTRTPARRGREADQGSTATIRVKPLKFGATIVRNTRQIRILLARMIRCTISSGRMPRRSPLDQSPVQPRHADASGVRGTNPRSLLSSPSGLFTRHLLAIEARSYHLDAAGELFGLGHSPSMLQRFGKCPPSA